MNPPPPQDGWYRKLVFVVLGLQEIGSVTHSSVRSLVFIVFFFWKPIDIFEFTVVK